MTSGVTGTTDFVRSKIERMEVVSDLEVTSPNVLSFAHKPQFIGAVETRERLLVLSSPMLSDADVIQAYKLGENITAIVNTGKGTHYSGRALTAARARGGNVLTFGQLLSAIGRQGGPRAYQDGRVGFCMNNFAKSKSVTEMQLICESEMRAVRPGLGDLRIVATSIYTFGAAHLMKELERHPNLDVVVNLNSYNQFTSDAYKRAKDLGKALVPGEGVFAMLRRDRDSVLADG